MKRSRNQRHDMGPDPENSQHTGHQATESKYSLSITGTCEPLICHYISVIFHNESSSTSRHHSAVSLYHFNTPTLTCYHPSIEQPIMNAPAGRSFYEVLRVHPHAQKQDIKNAYRMLALRYHPDKNQGDPSAKEIFQEVSNSHF